MNEFRTLGGKVVCKQCRAKSKRSQKRCRNPAMKNGCCALHGGKSTGARTKEGRARIAKVHTVHGRESRQARRDTSASLAEIRYLEELAFLTGMFPPGTEHIRGRKPIGMSVASEQLRHLTRLVKEDREEAILQIIRNKIESSV